MTDSTAPAMLPGTVVSNWDDLRRMATTAAHDAARQIREESLTREDVESISERVAERISERMADKMADKAVERMLDRLGIDKDKVSDFRRDLDWLRDARGIKETIVRQGFIATVMLLMSGLATAIVLALKGSGAK
jgi:hypothetical protein